jgi:hypothetical protein
LACVITNRIGTERKSAEEAESMPDTTTAGETWRDVVRREFQAAWYALDRAQMILYGEYRKTRDEQIMHMREKFGQACDMLTKAGMDELFPEPDDDDDEDLDEEAAGSR